EVIKSTSPKLPLRTLETARTREPSPEYSICQTDLFRRALFSSSDSIDKSVPEGLGFSCLKESFRFKAPDVASQTVTPVAPNPSPVATSVPSGLSDAHQPGSGRSKWHFSIPVTTSQTEQPFMRVE